MRHSDSDRELMIEMGVAINVGNRGIVLASFGRHDEALECYREAEEINRRLGNRFWVAMLLGNRGIIHGDRGENDQALACYSETIAIHQELGNGSEAARIYGNQGLVLRRIGRLKEAAESLSIAERVHRETDYNVPLAFWLAGRAMVRLSEVSRSRSPSESVELLKDALAAATECKKLRDAMGVQRTGAYVQTLAIIARCHQLLADTNAGRDGQAGEAIEMAEQASALAKELEIEPDAPDPDIREALGWVQEILGQ